MGTVIQWEYNIVQPLWKPVGQFLIMLNVALPYDPASSVSTQEE